MSRFHLSRIVALPVLALAMGAAPAVVAAVPATAATATYSATDLNSLGEADVPLAINASGEVTGYSYLSKEIQVECPPAEDGTPKKCFENPYHAFLWSNGTITDLGTLGGDFSAGLAINSSGEVVGWSQTKDGSDAFLFNGQKMVALASLATIYPRGIDDAGLIAGTCDNDSFPCVDNNGTITALPNPPGLTCGEVIAMNSSGQVLGDCKDSSGNTRAVVWTNGSPTVLPTLGGAETFGLAISNNGHVVGTSQTSTGGTASFLFSDGTITELNVTFTPAAINDSDVIVGANQVFSNGTQQDLDNLVVPAGPPVIDFAVGINDNGQIVASIGNADHAEVLTPN